MASNNKNTVPADDLAQQQVSQSSKKPKRSESQRSTRSEGEAGSQLKPTTSDFFAPPPSTELEDEPANTQFSEMFVQYEKMLKDFPVPFYGPGPVEAEPSPQLAGTQPTSEAASEKHTFIPLTNTQLVPSTDKDLIMDLALISDQEIVGLLVLLQRSPNLADTKLQLLPVYMANNKLGLKAPPEQVSALGALPGDQPVQTIQQLICSSNSNITVLRLALFDVELMAIAQQAHFPFAVVSLDSEIQLPLNGLAAMQENTAQQQQVPAFFIGQEVEVFGFFDDHNSIC